MSSVNNTVSIIIVSIINRINFIKIVRISQLKKSDIKFKIITIRKKLRNENAKNANNVTNI